MKFIEIFDLIWKQEKKQLDGRNRSLICVLPKTLRQHVAFFLLGLGCLEFLKRIVQSIDCATVIRSGAYYPRNPRSKGQRSWKGPKWMSELFIYTLIGCSYFTLSICMIHMDRETDRQRDTEEQNTTVSDPVISFLSLVLNPSNYIQKFKTLFLILTHFKLKTAYYFLFVFYFLYFVYHYTLWVRKNWATFIFTITLANVDRFQ